MRKLLHFPCSIHNKVKWVDYLFSSFKVCCFVFFALVSTKSIAQSLPPASSCTSGDLILVAATLPPNPGEDACGTCTPGTSITRTLFLSINNKTGSTRTSFAFWGTLEVYDAAGNLVSSTPKTDCRGPIIKNSVNSVNFGTITYQCGQSLKLTNLFLAWTSANNNEVCPLNSATINPKCGTLPLIQIVAGLDGNIVVTDATCTAGGSIAVSPFGGKAPYSVTINGVTHSGVAAGATTNFTNLAAATYSITITDATAPTACTTTKTRTVGAASSVTANAGADFTKTCLSNATGKQIGEASQTGFTYSWSPTTGLSDATISNPTANPSVTTTYTVTKTYTSSGCFGTDDVTVTVNNTAVTANAGADFSKTCLNNATGKQIGEASQAGFTYSWSPTTGLSNATISNPTANPSVTTTYTATKTNTSSGCFGTDDITVTVNNTAVTANAGTDFTKTCLSNTTGKQIGETSQAEFTYSWSPATGLSDASISNPTANPSVTTTYTVIKTNTSSGCFGTDDVTVTVNNTAVIANAGADFSKTCVSNATGKQIGEASQTGFTYSWSPTTGLSDATISNPTANPSVTTTYTVTKTYTSSGCFGTDDVTVTVNNTAVTANAGADFSKTCLNNATGRQIGEASQAGFTYSWSPATGLSDATISNPTANPSVTTTYTVTKTNTGSGCFSTDDITVTVNNTAVTSNAGTDFTKTCLSNTTGKQIGEASQAGFTYSWSPTTGLSDASISNPIANPSVTTTYTVTKTNTSSSCFGTDDVTVTVNNTKPSFTICLVQPDLCTQYGSVTITASGGSGFSYSIDGVNFSNTSGVFNNLASGSVTNVQVKNGDGCASDVIACGNLTSSCGSITKASAISELTTELQTTVKAYPNPFSDRIKFVVTSPVAGRGNLEVYNMMGQRIKTVYQGFIAAGTQIFELSMPTQQIANLVYVLRIGEKKISGKILQINQ